MTKRNSGLFRTNYDLSSGVGLGIAFARIKGSLPGVHSVNAGSVNQECLLDSFLPQPCTDISIVICFWRCPKCLRI